MNADRRKEHPAEIRFLVHDACFCIVAARFNETIVNALIEGAEQALTYHDVSSSAIDVVRVPGAFELPLAAQRAARTGRYDGIVAVGAVIRGETSHYKYLSFECIRGLARVSLDESIPVGMGVLTTDTVEQAQARSGDYADNKGAEAALAALELVSLFRELVI